MDLEFKGMTALVTGASRGSGFAVARHFAQDGCDVRLASRKAEDLETARVRIAGGKQGKYVSGTIVTVDGGRTIRDRTV